MTEDEWDLAYLKRILKAREGIDGYKDNVAAIRARIAEIEAGATRPAE